MKSVLIFLVPLCLAAEEERLSSGYLFESFPKTESSEHCIQDLSSVIVLEDGSSWELSLYDMPTLNRWEKGDPIALTQNHRWFTKHPYRLVNQMSNTSVEVSLARAPKHAKSIQSAGTIALTLSDGTTWEISPSDASILDTWLAQDPILTGLNTGEETSYRHILIHTNTNTCVRANKL